MVRMYTIIHANQRNANKSYRVATVQVPRSCIHYCSYRI